MSAAIPVPLGLAQPSQRQVDPPGATEEMGVPDPRRERPVHRVERFGRLAVLVERPGERRLGGGVPAQVDVEARPLDRLRAVLPDVGVEVREVMVVVDPAASRRRQVPGERPIVGVARLLALPHQRVQVAERVLDFRSRHTVDHALVQAAASSRRPRAARSSAVWSSISQ